MKRYLSAILLPFLLLASCGGSSGSVNLSDSGSSGGANGSITIAATDAPFDFALLESAIIRVDRLAVKVDGFDDSYDDGHDDDGDDDSSASSFTMKPKPGAGADDDGDDGGSNGFINLNLDETLEFDLVELRNGVTQFMLTDTLPEGNISQMRLYITRAELVLTNGNLYNIKNDTIKITSQQTSGFKVFIDPPIRVEAGEMTNVILDFDLSKTFKAVPANDPANAKFFMFHPVLRAANQAMSGELRGTVMEDDGMGGVDENGDPVINLVPAGAAMVHLLPQGELDVDQSVATTLTEDDGTYAILGVDPGVYDVLGTKGSTRGRVDGVVISVEQTTTTDITLE